jgi:putative restriction endonuclease
MTVESFSGLDPRHRDALLWFAQHAGQEVAWPAPLAGLFLVNKAKGIHKPRGFEHALSVRQSLNGPYEDSFHTMPDGSWSLQYAYEVGNADNFTNRALRACMKDRVPVGVIIQIRSRPSARYKVLGLGLVVGDTGGVFTIAQPGSGVQRVEGALETALTQDVFDASNQEDGRKRELRAIALRRGQPAFRRELLDAYEGKCAVTGCTVTSILEAAHIVPYLGQHTNHVQNGLLLRADVHTLFDLGLLNIDPFEMVIRIHKSLSSSEYEELDGKLIRRPREKRRWPSVDALLTRQLISE